MIATFLELWDIDCDPLGLFLRSVLYGRLFLMNALVVDNLLFEALCRLLVLHQGIYNSLFDFTYYPAFYICISQLVLRLALEDGVHDFDCNSCNNAVPYLGSCPGLMVVFVDSLEYTFLECSLVGSSVGCVLPVDIGVILLPVAVCMCECKFKMLVFKADKRIEPAVTESLFNKVHKTVL